MRLLRFLLPISIGACGGDSATSAEPVIPVASVKISWKGNQLAQGQSAQMSVTLRDERGAALYARTVIWASSDPAIAAVSSSGLVTGISRTGSATITATSEAKSDTTTVTTFWAYAFGARPTYTVNVSSLTIRDELRNRDIQTLVRLPVGAPRPLPVVFVVFALPDGQQSDPSLGDTFAAAGYAVIHVGTAPYDQSQLCAELRVTDCAAMIWPNRLAAARDVSTLMNNLASIGARIGAPLDIARVGISGTSSGGAVVMYLAGATVDLSPSVTGVSLADNRFAAFLGNSAPATRTDNGSPSGFTGTSWAKITKPTMQQALAGDVDAAGRRGIYDVMPPGDKYLAYFNTMAVGSYEPSQGGVFGALIASNTLAFFDTYLRGSAEAKEWLTTNQLARGSNGLAQMSSK